MTKLPRIEFARSRLPILSDMCTIIPTTKSGVTPFEVPCSVQTPTLKLGHGYGHEGGGPLHISRRVTKTLLFDREVTIKSGWKILWQEENIEFIAGQSSRKSSNEPYITINITEEPNDA